jgi:hypothetical protein
MRGPGSAGSSALRGKSDRRTAQRLSVSSADPRYPANDGSGARPFFNRGAWVKLGVKRWSLPGSWFSPGSVARPMMGVRGVTPRGVKRSDRAYARVDLRPLRGRPHPPSRQGQRLRRSGAGVADRASGCLLARPPELGTVGPNAMQDDGNLASDRDARLPAADPFR